jgi:hypothetical protein
VTLKRELDDGDRFAIREFDVSIYNRTVRSAIEFKELGTSAPDVCIAHFKGTQSKAEMHEATEHLLRRIAVAKA